MDEVEADKLMNIRQVRHLSVLTAFVFVPRSSFHRFEHFLLLGCLQGITGIVTLQKRTLRLIYFSKSKEHAVPFILKSNCLPLSSLFFRDCSYLLYDINRQTAPLGILNQFVKTSQIHNYRTRSVSSDSFYVKFSRTDKMYAFFTRIGAQIWNSIPYSIKILKRSSFRKRIKELLLNFLRSEDDYVEVSRLIL